MDDHKLKAAMAALDYVEDGMKLGLGTGSTAEKFVRALGEKVKDGLNVTCVASSEATQSLADELNIPMTSLDEVHYLDLTVDGADEVTEDLMLIKGGGGALLREKIVAMASERTIIIADDSKLVKTLGKFPLPIEVIKFGLGSTQAMIKEISADAECEGEINIRMSSENNPFVTDNGNYILDCAFGSIPDPILLEDVLKMIPGIVTTGLFIGVSELAILAGNDGLNIIEWSEDFLEI